MNKVNHYTILMMGRNSIDWIDDSVHSALNQNHENFEIIAIDAESNDGTYELLSGINDDKFKLYRNKQRQYQSQNVFDGCRLTKEESIIVTLDFDDMLAHQDILSTLDKYYDDNTWMTYGSYRNESKVKGFGRYSEQTIEENAFRKDAWRATHLRTFRRELALKIREQDFKGPDGEWIPVAGDLVFMWPMLEMCGDRFKFIPEVLYLYNTHNPDSEFRACPSRVRSYDRFLRSKNPYQKIDTL